MSIVCWFIFIFILFVFANEFYRKTNHYYNNYCFEKKYFKIKDYNSITNIVTGTSNALAAVASFQKNENYLILARRHQGLITDYYLLNSVVDKAGRGTNVLLFFSPSVLLFDEKIKTNLERNLKSIPSIIVSPTALTRLKVRFPLVFDIRQIKYILFDEKRKSDFYVNKTETISVSQAEKKAKLLTESWKKQFNINDFTMQEIYKNRQSIVDENKKYIISMIELCKEYELNPIIVSSPFSQKLLDILGEEFINYFNDLITDICKKESVTYLNYIKDEDFVQSYSLFSDGCFVLNKQGSYIFMRKITKQIGRNQNEVC